MLLDLHLLGVGGRSAVLEFKDLSCSSNHRLGSLSLLLPLLLLQRK